MITAITLKNFKCFKEETRIPTNQFNLLTGINGRGKSTALQPLLLFKQSVEVNEFANELYLNGSCINLGTSDDVRNNKVSTNEVVEIKFEFLSEDDLLKSPTYFFERNVNDDMSLRIQKIRLRNNIDILLEENEEGEYYLKELRKFLPRQIQIFKKYDEERERKSISFGKGIDFDKIHYLSADRLEPQEFYFKTPFTKFPTVGVRGENLVNILLKIGDVIVNDKLYIQRRKSSNIKNISKDLLTQTGEWLNEIFDGGNIQLEDTKSRIANLLLNATGKEQDKHSKPVNIGFGFSYALPIIVSGLIAKEGEILIVENPEAHLHPRAQSRITKFLAKVSQCGVQVFIETHSDHVLNASRIAVLDNIISNEQLNILYFSDDEKNQVVTIPVKEDGSIEEWPDGFFDQTDKDYERLFGL